jgi:D-beta-D-heptose 7-phosphate kinase/D-beta-D-heptose 1-phosphate adenosyltransferase
LYKSYRGKKDDENSNILRHKLKQLHITYVRLWTDSYAPTTVKTRVWSGNQQVVRYDKENTEQPSTIEMLSWIKRIQTCIIEDKINTVVFSDYNKGTLTDNIIQTITSVCNELGSIITILDPKRPTFHEINGLTIVKPNAKEMKKSGLTPENCSHEMHDTYVVNTRGKYQTLIAHNGTLLEHVPTSDQEVIDVCGAGDVHCAVLALAFDKENIIEAVSAANVAASTSVLHRGCYNLSQKELKAFISCDM